MLSMFRWYFNFDWMWRIRFQVFANFMGKRFGSTKESLTVHPVIAIGALSLYASYSCFEAGIGTGILVTLLMVIINFFTVGSRLICLERGDEFAWLSTWGVRQSWWCQFLGFTTGAMLGWAFRGTFDYKFYGLVGGLNILLLVHTYLLCILDPPPKEEKERKLAYAHKY
jgi:hypothetical protein